METNNKTIFIRQTFRKISRSRQTVLPLHDHMTPTQHLFDYPNNLTDLKTLDYKKNKTVGK